MFQLSKESKEFIKKELTRYEDKFSAIIPCLYKAQEQHGWISPDVIDALAKEMDLPHSRIWEVAKFYTMFNKEPVGKFHIQVCCNISCSMAGGRELTKFICDELGVKENTVSENGKWTVTRVECLGSCDTAPMMQVNDEYYENLTEESVKKLLKSPEFK